jgi:hypothetical protein
MAWTTPITWVNGVAVDATDLNAQIKNNLRYLKGLDGVPYIEDALELPEQATPGTPSAGRGRLFVGNSGVNNGVASAIDDAGTVYQMLRYAQPSFTPTFGGATSNGTFTYVQQLSRARRTQDEVLVSLVIQAATMPAAPTGGLRINGLPHPAAIASGLTISYSNVSTIARALIPAGQTYIEFYDAAGALISSAVASASLYIALTGTYPL